MDLHTSVIHVSEMIRLTESSPVVLQMVPARPDVQNSGDNELERSIKAAMMRMKKVSADSDEEDRGDEETRSLDWEN